MPRPRDCLRQLHRHAVSAKSLERGARRLISEAGPNRSLARNSPLFLRARPGHRVDGLEPGVYRYGPRQGEFEPIRSGDQRVAATGLSLGQDLAGNACVAFSMIADLDRAADYHGDRGYRYAYFEAGAIGHRLYIAAEAMGLGATGIGAFFDDKVHRYLGLASGQVVYHFAIGYPVPDPRVVAE